MTEPAEHRLMRYLDGEASPDEAREVEAWLAESSDGRALARDLEAIGDTVRAIAVDRGAPADGIADAVLHRIEAEKPASLDGARRKKAEKRSSVVLPAIGLSLAAAAAVVLFLRSPGTSAVKPGVPVAATSVATPSQSAPLPDEMAARDEGPGASIESVDFGTQNGTIFMVASGPQVTPVIWLVDDGDASEG